MLEKTMKISSTMFHDKHHHNHSKRERFLGLPFVFSSLLVASIFCLFFLNYPNPSTLIPQQGIHLFENFSQNQEHPIITTQTLSSSSSPPPSLSSSSSYSPSSSSSQPPTEQKPCDLFKGHWVQALGGSSTYYTNSSCPSIPDGKNCFRHGRKDSDFLNWRWKPDECELPRFDPKTFFQIVHGKTMAFIGDSVARNHVESLLCLLSQEEVPKDMYKDSEDRFRKWYFPMHNFSLMMLWSRFLVVGEERMVNGTGTSVYDMQLDKVDSDWAKELPFLDYAVISCGHWFFRGMRLHEGGKEVGCVYCDEPNVTRYNVDFPLRKAMRTAFRYISECTECRRRRMVTVMRTFAAAHFENGYWNTGGYCNRTGPMSESEVDFGKFEWEVRNVQMEEFERGRKNGGRFEVVDVSRAMLMRADGHPGEHWGNKWMKGYNDCTHWCMPGPVDMWSELLLAVLRKASAFHLNSI